jgi:HSP20 family protein
VSIEAKARKQADKKDGERIVYRERSVASFSRAITLPAEVDEAASTAKLDNGVLTLTLAKKQPVQPRRITIN